MKCQFLLNALFAHMKVGHWWISALLWMSLATLSRASVILRSNRAKRNDGQKREQRDFLKLDKKTSDR
ncbi:MAG: hypothetical protein V7K73_21980 [Nostoc sp.]